MKTFEYKAISNSGIEISGVIKAQDKADAVIRLGESCKVVNSLKEVHERGEVIEKLSVKKVDEKNLSLVCKQFSIILSAGLPAVKTVALVAGQTEDKLLRNLLGNVAEDIAAGYSLSDSFELRGPFLPPTFIETVRAGEESGSLDTTFERLSDFYAKRSKVKGKVVSALTYPLFVLAVAVIVIAIIMVKAVPQFTSTFATMGLDLPFPTRALIAASDFCRHWLWLVLVFIIAIVIALKVYGSTEKGGIELGKARIGLPVLGKIEIMSAASQFANTLSTMLAAGLPAIKALNITGKSIGNKFIGHAVLHAVENIESGYRIGDSLKAEKALPELLVEMTAVGEESGSIEDTLRVIGEYYDNEVDVTTTRAVSLLEPIIICLLAGFVILVLLAVYLPMFSLYGTI